MPASLLMIAASLFFAMMGVCVKLGSARYAASEMVMYRGLVGIALTVLLARHRGIGLRTSVLSMHVGRSITGALSLLLWFYALGHLPLATAITLNYMSSIWMALFLLGGAVVLGGSRVDGRLVFTVLIGFAGVALVLRPTFDQQQLWAGLSGLLSGILAAMAYLQVSALGRVGEPELRVVFYFSIGSAVAGALSTLAFWFTGQGGWHWHSAYGGALLLGTGLFATSAQLTLTRAYTIGKPLVNASLQYLGIVFSALLGLLLFGDRPTLGAIGGMVLIVGAGLAATQLRGRSASRNFSDIKPTANESCTSTAP